MELPILQAGGFIDSFAGDEIKVLFDTSTDNAVRAGIGMSRAIEELNRRYVASGEPELRMGMGASTGAVVLGTVGGPNRIQCSVVGDTVNLGFSYRTTHKSLWWAIPHKRTYLSRPD